MEFTSIAFPRQLEADGSVEKIRSVLSVRKTRLWPEGKLEVPVLNISESMISAMKTVRMQRRIRFGLDDIFDRLAVEKKGIDHLHEQTQSKQNERISRLLLFSNDGAERLYRRIEQVLNEHHQRILGCLLDTDGKTLGKLMTGGSTGIKVILVEHKDAVSDVLRALAGNEK
jgi:hypothetical protein